MTSASSGAPATGTEPQAAESDPAAGPDSVERILLRHLGGWVPVSVTLLWDLREDRRAALDAREAEVRRKVAAEVRALFADPWRAKEFLDAAGLSMSCGPASAGQAIAAEIEAGPKPAVKRCDHCALDPDDTGVLHYHHVHGDVCEGCCRENYWDCPESGGA